jgi:hypothetical protein
MPTVSPPFLLASTALHSLPIETFGYIWGIIFCIVLFHNFDVQRNIQIIYLGVSLERVKPKLKTINSKFYTQETYLTS